jgi:phosphohistidine phosphatase
MKVVLFRHGPAGTRDGIRWPDDDERPLSAQGKLKTHAAAVGLAQMEREVTQIVTSPLKRCLETADLLNDVLHPLEGVVTLGALAPAGSRDAILQSLSGFRAEASLVLVGHEPDLGRLAGWLVFNSGETLPLKKAGACGLEFDGPVRPGGAVLSWLLAPRYLREMGKKKTKARKAFS